jgi:hypothetical protein
LDLNYLKIFRQSAFHTVKILRTPDLLYKGLSQSKESPSQPIHKNSIAKLGANSTANTGRALPMKHIIIKTRM